MRVTKRGVHGGGPTVVVGDVRVGAARAQGADDVERVGERGVDDGSFSLTVWSVDVHVVGTREDDVYEFRNVLPRGEREGGPTGVVVSSVDVDVGSGE